MINVSTVRSALRNNLMAGKIKDSGYDLQNGRKYVEIRNAQFVVDEDYIFDIPEYPNMRKWYSEHYFPIALPQIDCLVDKLSNSNSRQAIIFMGESSEYYEAPLNEMICTMYMHVFLDKNDDGTYDMTYVVHMRSSDAVEFRSDLKFHRYIIEDIKSKLYNKYNYNISDTTIIWNADSLQLYDKQFEKIM